uniref:Transcription elongation factor TFIIS n=1 Tax=Mimivirus LCMiAC01 TaxID=2506608 RepID=A0A481YZF5_9VIRU|nr:MAG: transcription elongation factor TFIIS [Mimivirus LCMiAC01]
MNKHKDMELYKIMANISIDKLCNYIATNIQKKHSPSIFDKSLDFLIKEFKSKITPDMIEIVSKNIDRKLVLNQLSNALNDFNRAIKIEAGIFEHCIVYSLKNNLSMEHASAIYYDKYHDILHIFDKESSVYNVQLIKKILKDKILAQTLPFLSPQQIDPKKWEKYIRKREMIEYKKNNMAISKLYKCRKCGKRRCKISMMQTRGGDEGMTVYICCTVCSHTWKH